MVSTVELLTSHNAPQLRHLYTGLAMLAAEGGLRFRQQVVRGGSGPLHAEGRCLLVVDGVRVGVDMRDDDQIVATDDVDVWIKRSYPKTGAPANAVPYGLNYPVLRSGVDLRMVSRASLPEGGRFVSDLARALAVDRLLGRPACRRVHDLRPRPAVVPDAGPTVVLQTRPWPASPELPEELRADRDAVTTLRASCIRALRKELGPRFVGGFTPTAHARRNYADCIVDTADAAGPMLLHRMGAVPIVVTTRGLVGSVTWTTGEAVALGRAVVAETLRAVIPGGFDEGTHYLAFDDVDGCVARCVHLVEHPDEVAAVSAANTRYHDQHLRPDRQVRRVLDAASDLARTCHTR